MEWNTKNQLHERSSGEVMSRDARWLRNRGEIRGKIGGMERVQRGYFFVQTRVASKRSRWENSRVEIKFAGKSEIYTVGRPLDLPVWSYLSIFSRLGNENCNNFGYFHSYEISSAFSSIPTERKIETMWKNNVVEKGRGFFSLEKFCEKRNSVSSLPFFKGVSLPLP